MTTRLNTTTATTTATVINTAQQDELWASR